ncbi:UNVERIFIED_CONTAM: hypothetical protein Sindi_2457100 [Sesamum indicum]
MLSSGQGVSGRLGVSLMCSNKSIKFASILAMCRAMSFKVVCCYVFVGLASSMLDSFPSCSSSPSLLTSLLSSLWSLLSSSSSLVSSSSILLKVKCGKVQKLEEGLEREKKKPCTMVEEEAGSSKNGDGTVATAGWLEEKA